MKKRNADHNGRGLIVMMKRLKWQKLSKVLEKQARLPIWVIRYINNGI
jgi:hypothetical protein